MFYDSKEELIKPLIEEGALQTPQIINAFNKIDRKDFVAPGYESQAYIDAPLPIGYDQTISQPYTVAIMLEMLAPKETDTILDVGSGSGWTTALLASITKNPNQVLGVELIPELVEFGQNNIAKYGFPKEIIKQAPTDRIGSPNKDDKFTKILVNAGANQVPQDLIEQLEIGGRMIIPVNGLMMQVKKVSPTEIEKSYLPQGRFTFVPLVGASWNA